MERRLKRTAWKRATSLLASAFVAASAVVVPQTWNAQEAGAYVLKDDLQVNHGTPDGPVPKVVRNSVNIEGTHKPGDRFTYDITSIAKAPEWEDGRQGNTLEDFTLTLTVPKLAPLTGVNQQLDNYRPSASDFIWSDGVRRAIKSQDRRTEGDNYVYTFTFDVRGHRRGDFDLMVNASLPAQINPEIGESQELTASVETQVTADDLGIEWPGSIDLDFSPTDDRCVLTASRTATHDGKGRNGDGYGSWLMQVKSGSTTPNLVPDGPIKVQFENEQGVQLRQPEYNPNDSRPPYFANTDYQTRPGNQWKSSAEWEFNPETKTGTQWVADGTVVKVSQNYRDLNCTHWGTDFWAYGGDINFGIESLVAPRVSRGGTKSDGGFEIVVDEPAFEVSKVADGRRSRWVAPKATLVDGNEGEEGATYRANYTVTVENTGSKEGQSGPIVDTPAIVPGYDLVGAQVAGQDVEIVDGKLRLSEGETLLPGQTREFKLSIDYKRTAEATPKDLENAGKCETRGTEPSKTGVVNTVTLDGEDENQLGDNHDCVEIPAEPAFNVMKVAKGREGVDKAPTAVDLDGGKFRADYTVSVVNIGGVEGTFGRVIDQPKEIDGFEIVEVTVDGNAAKAIDGGYLVSEGETLEPGTPTQRGTRDFAVSVTYQRKDDATDEALENAAKCEPVSRDHEPSKTGAANVVKLAGERDDLAVDNDDCVEIPQKPEFNVKKEAVKKEAERLPNGSFKASYTITVENIGKTSGRFETVSDTAFSGNGIKPRSFRVNGILKRAVSAFEPGYFIVSDGGHLEPGENVDFDVEVIYSVDEDAVDDDWDKVAKCEPGEDGSFVSGAHNTASLRNEAPGREDDNSDCVVIKRPATFEVDKEADDEVATPNSDGSFTAKYTVTVSNTSPVDGEYGRVYDSPREQPGFTITSVKVGNDEVEATDGRYLVSPGAELEGESETSFQVAVTYKPNDDITSDQWKNAGVCEAAEGEQSGTLHGLVNVARLIGGTPGKEDDNSACVPLFKSAVGIKKFVNGKDAETADDFPVVKPGEPMVIQYVLTNNGPVTLTEVDIKDVVEQGDGKQKALQDEINAKLEEQLKQKLTLEPGESRAITIQVTAPEGVHKNAAHPVVPTVTVEKPSTIPSTTRPPLTVPPVTFPKTTIPGTTVPGTTLPGITVPPLTLTPVVTTDRGGSTPTTDPIPTSEETPAPNPQLAIKKTINGQDANSAADAPVVAPGEDMTITYTVTNTGNVALHGVRVVDEVTEGAAKSELQQAIDAELEKLDAVDLEPGKSKDFKVTVKATKGGHVNVARPTVPATVPGTTRPGTTVTGTTDPSTTIPGTTDPGTTVPGTTNPVLSTTPSDSGRVNDPRIEIKKTINGQDANYAADAPVIAPGEDMTITYTVTNTGNVDFKGVHVLDEVTEGAAKDELQQAINDELAKLKAVDLAAGTAAEFTVTVKATKGGHENEARPTVPPVTVPGTTRPGTTVPGTSNETTTVPGTTDPGTTVPGTEITVTTPSDPGRANDPQVAITKLINGEDANEPESAATVAAGAPMTISYVVSNPGNVDLKGVNVVDEVDGEDNAALQTEINEALKGVDPFNLAAGESTTVTAVVDAPEGAHKNVARPTVPPVTIPGTTVPDSTVPGTTVPGTSNETTTVPGTTRPDTTVPGTTVSSTVVTVTTPSDPGHSKPEPKAGLEVKKFINGRDDNALVTAGEDMEITYRVTNTGETTIDGIRLLDEVKEDNADLQQQIDAQLGEQPSFGLAPGESRDVTVTVKAPVGRHDNAVRVTVPPVTVPGTTVPGTTVPGTTNATTTNPGTTVPGTTNPGTTVTLTSTPSDDASSDSPQLAILKEIKAADEDEDAWRDAEDAADALPVKPGADMQLRYTVTNTGSVALSGIDVVDSVTRLDDGDADAFTAVINDALAAEGRGFDLQPGESKAIVITVAAPEGYHVNEAIATAPPVTATETVVTSVPGTTDATTTVPGTVTTETTVVERVPNTPVDKAQSTPTVDPTPCDCTVATTTITPSPVTVTRTTPVTTVQTITPEPTTVVTTVVATPTPTTTPGGATVVVTPATTTPTPGRVIVIVDEGGNTVTRITPAPEEGGSPSETVTHTIPGGKTTTTLTTEPGGNTVNKCVANAVRSPILYMVPLLLAGQVLGDAAAPYIAQFNDQFNKINAEIQEEIRRNTPDLGFGRRGHENEQVAQLRARLDEANRQLGQLANMPEVREYGKWAAVALGVVVAGSVLYDWCTNEEGEAFTAIGPKKTTTIDDVRVGGSSLLGRGDAATSVAPVTQTPEGEATDGDVEADAGSAGSSSTGLGDGSSDGSSEGSSGSSDGSSDGSSGSSK